jgi:lipoprotein-anchoring transpeptidase ErfK/SrfK
MTRLGQLVPEAKIRKVERVVRPALVPKRARLIHVRLAEQTLVAYEGEQAVYATLISSGKAGFETPMGLFRVHAKHVSTTMDGLAGEEEAYSIEDVPWTMYFQGSYALHAAFWHDRFGNTRSHGCINLAPADARWLFEWATPTLPSGFHAVMSTKDNPGTYVLID